MSILPDWLTVREASAELLDVTPQRWHQLIRTYDIETRKLDSGLVLLKRADAERVALKERPSGVHVDQQPKRNGQRRKR